MKARTRSQAGYTLIEVLVGILIFALGMMALAQLQGNLSKSSSDSNARTVAINIAEEEIERLRSFSQITRSSDVYAFNNIDDDPELGAFTPSVNRGGIDYTITPTVTDYYYNPATEQFQLTKPNSDIVNPAMKRVELTVSWATGDAAQSFQIDETNATTGLGTGRITVADLISSFTTTTGAKVVLNSNESLFSPPVDYNPGQNPDIISIQLGQNKFKESTTPLPDVIRQDELVETKFDVVTYSQNSDGALFLRREEFRAVSCQCTLRLPTVDAEGGRRPTVWEGTEYTEGEFVSKPFGESASSQQSILCDQCCRDHHDGGTGEQDQGSDPGRSRYNPFRASSDYFDSSAGALQNDHKHYRRDRNGDFLLAQNDGDFYLEACRMVRKDGFFRVAQDLRQEGLNAFPGNFLDESGEVAEYSKYVTDAVSLFEAAIVDGYESNTTSAPTPLLTPPQSMSPAVEFPASSKLTATDLPTLTGATQQQLRSRGIYIDYMTDDLRQKINCLDDGGVGENCGTPGVSTALEIIPFYDVQLTWLARWNEEPVNNPIDVTNEAVADNNTHSRGVAVLQSGSGTSAISSSAHTGNIGLTATDPVDPANIVESYDLYANANDSSTPPPLSSVVIRGTISSSVAGVKAADVEIEATDAQCDRTNTGFICVIEAGANKPLIRIFNFSKPNRIMLGCSAVMNPLGVEHSSISGDSWTRFRLPTTSRDDADIVIREDTC
ncbi:MAG: prepilin-type N-terminal cleavage/methylation domain-containing protein [Xanthomonadales bacterium]|nr:prepilin-type N-terminal cleavage/methylation domain-containing protein [Xanthomonadales bacterium]